MMWDYTIHLEVKVHGYREEVAIKLRAENQWDACEKLGAVLTRLCAEAPTESNGEGKT